jgi:hydrogenase maturation protease
MSPSKEQSKILVMGVGNTLLQDDGVGIHITDSLRSAPAIHPAVEFIDGGTLGLSLLPDIEDAGALIVVDAAELGQAPGTLQVFLGDEMDEHLSGKKRTVHEVAVSDLLAAAALRGNRPARRALVAIQPACTEWGMEPTAVVAAAIPKACEAITGIARSWREEAHEPA